MNSSAYHTPVLLQDCIDGLKISSNGIYVDVTYGGGGHSREIMTHLEDGKLFGFDQDAEAQDNLIQSENFTLIPQNFRFLKNNLRFLEIDKIDGLLADLGVSSHQFDIPDRGFSIRFDAELDMRMNQHSDLTAKKILNTYSEEELYRIFREYGEIKGLRKLVNAILIQRDIASINTVFELKEALVNCADKRKPNQYFAQVFQALRIEVNDELGALKDLLVQAESVLKPGGRLVVMSYHSLEDRLVKNFIKSGNFQGKIEQDFFGKIIKPLKAINNKVIIPSEEEIVINNRSRSAKLRIAEKI